MKSNIKNNYHEINSGNIPSAKNNNNIIKQINSHANSNKNIGKFYNYGNQNSYKDKAINKITKIIYSNNQIGNYNNKNSNFNFTNSFLKEKTDNINNYNKFRKSKTSDKTGNHVLNGYKPNNNNQNSKNKKVILKQYSDNLKNNYNLTIDKSSKYDNSVFNQVLKYYTIKSESKTLQIEDLSSYLTPIKNILGMSNKAQSKQNTSNSINVNKHYEFNDYNKDDDNIDDDLKFKDNINLNSNNDKDDLLDIYNYQNNINNNNQNLVKNSVLNNNVFHSQRNSKLSSSPFNIQIKQISNKQINTNNINNNMVNNREVSEIDTQISTNNNLNHEMVNQQEFNQFRTRKMSLPKGGINLGAIQLKNKILLNILHKRKQNK